MIDGKPYVFETPIHADFALVKAYKGDRWGNRLSQDRAQLRADHGQRAAKVAIVQSEVVPLGALNPEHIVTPGISSSASSRCRSARGRAGRRTRIASRLRRPDMKRLTRDEMAASPGTFPKART